MANLPTQCRPAWCNDAVGRRCFGGHQRELLGWSPRPGVKTSIRGIVNLMKNWLTTDTHLDDVRARILTTDATS
jgi:hypothetical protein